MHISGIVSMNIIYIRKIIRGAHFLKWKQKMEAVIEDMCKDDMTYTEYKTRT